MRKFTRIAGGPLQGAPAYIARAVHDAEREAREESTPSLTDYLQIEGRVYTLEKEMQMVSNLLLLGIMIGGYFAYRWYVQNVMSIPGVGE
jgi:hypothetical protein